MTTPSMTWDIPTMAAIIGELPPGDHPKAWWSSLDEGVVAAYYEYEQALRTWKDGFTELCELSKIDAKTIRFAHTGSKLLGLLPPKGASPPTWWRLDKNGYWIPRKRSQSEKNSQIAQRWHALNTIPMPIDFLPGLPSAIWLDGKPYPVQASKPAKAVLVFTGKDPDDADPPFCPDNRWTRMKLSTFHLLRERQNGKHVVRPPDATGVRRQL
jgi:hypothetical protein